MKCKTGLPVAGTLSGHICAFRCSLPHPEEQERQTKGGSLRPIEAIPGTPLEKWIPKRLVQLLKEGEEGREASDVDSPVFVEGQSTPVEREGVDLVESTVGGEEDVTPRPQNADCIVVDSSDQPDDVREREPHVELPTSSADNLIPEALSHKMEESTKQVVPETDSNAHGRPSRQWKPPSRYGAWVSG